MTAVHAELQDDVKNLECTLSVVHGLIDTFSSSFDSPHQELRDTVQSAHGVTSIFCKLDNGTVYFIDGDPDEVFHQTNIISGESRLFIEGATIKESNHMDISSIATLSVFTDIEPDSKFRLTEPAIGQKKMLVIIIKDAFGNAPTQDIQKMSDDVFLDENNLRKRYMDCSNDQLEFVPAEGNNVENGIMLVETNVNLSTRNFVECGDEGMKAATSVERDYTMLICPDSTDFQGAIAWADNGSLTWYKSNVASFPTVQTHELGHNFLHSHSGKGTNEYGDGTCIMSYFGSASDIGTQYCFNGAKTYYFGWFSEHQSDVFLSSSNILAPFTLVGVEAIRNDIIQKNHLVVVRVHADEFLKEDLFIMFNRKEGANIEVPQDGNRVVIVSQAPGVTNFGSYHKSLWAGSLTEGEKYTEKYTEDGTNLIIKVCSIDLAIIGGQAAILIGLSNTDTDLDCEQTPPPSQSPSMSLVPSISYRPTYLPSFSPSSRPSTTGRPSASPSKSNIPSRTPSSTPTLAVTTPTCATTASIHLQTDYWGSETKFLLKDSDHTEIWKGGGDDDLLQSLTLYAHQFCLHSCEVYTFEIYDHYGDGLCNTLSDFKPENEAYFSVMINGIETYHSDDSCDWFNRVITIGSPCVALVTQERGVVDKETSAFMFQSEQIPIYMGFFILGIISSFLFRRHFTRRKVTHNSEPVATNDSMSVGID